MARFLRTTPSGVRALPAWAFIVAAALLSGAVTAQTTPPPLAISNVLRQLGTLSASVPNSAFKTKLQELRRQAKQNRKKILTAEEAISARASNKFPSTAFPSPYQKALAATSADEPGAGTTGGTYGPSWGKNQLIVFTGDLCFGQDVEGELLKDAEIWVSIISAETCANNAAFKLSLAAVILAHEILHTTQSRSSDESKDAGECEAACFEKRFVNELIASGALSSTEEHCFRSWCVVAECRVMNHCGPANCSSFPWNQ